MRTIDSAIMDRLAAKELRPFLLLDLNIDGIHYRYTDCDVPLVVGGSRYEARGFKLEPVRYSLGTVVDSAKMQIDNLDNTLTPVFVGGTPQGSVVTMGLILMDNLGANLAPTSCCTDKLDDQDNVTGWTAVRATISSVAGGVTGRRLQIVATDNYGYAETVGASFVAGDVAQIKMQAGAAGGNFYAAAMTSVAGSLQNWIIPETEGDGAWHSVDTEWTCPATQSDWELWVYAFYNANTSFFDDVSVRKRNVGYLAIGDQVTLFQGTIDGWDLDEEKVSLTVASELVQWSQRTLEKHSSSCRWKKFKGTECTYAGAETWCDRTYTRCAALGNQANFGGFRWLPSIIDREIWWGPAPAVPESPWK